MHLLQFKAGEIYISPIEAAAILRFYWPSFYIDPSRLREQDLSFAQGLLLQGIDASYEMGFVEILFRTFYGRVPGTFVDIRKLAVSFAKKAFKHWFKHYSASKHGLDVKIYESVRVTVARNFRSEVELMKIDIDG